MYVEVADITQRQVTRAHEWQTNIQIFKTDT